MSPTEEDETARALLYQENERKRAAAVRERAEALRGDPAAAADLKRRWLPLENFLKETRNNGG